MCPECGGLGRKLGANTELFLDESKSLNEGAIRYPGYGPGNWEWNILNESGLLDMDRKIADYPKEERDLLLYGKARKVSVKFGGKAINITFEGIIEKFTNKYIKKDLNGYSAGTQKTVEPYIVMGPCNLCNGSRLSPQALGVKIGNYNIAELQAMEVDELVEVIRNLSAPEAEPILAALESRLTHLCDIGDRLHKTITNRRGRKLPPPFAKCPVTDTAMQKVFVDRKLPLIETQIVESGEIT